MTLLKTTKIIRVGEGQGQDRKRNIRAKKYVNI